MQGLFPPCQFSEVGTQVCIEPVEEIFLSIPADDSVMRRKKPLFIQRTSLWHAVLNMLSKLALQKHFLKSGLNAADITLTSFACVGAEVKSLSHQSPVFLIAYGVLISTSLKFSSFPHLNHSA